MDFKLQERPTANKWEQSTQFLKNRIFLFFLCYFCRIRIPTDRSLETGSQTVGFDLVSVCSTRTDLSRTGDLGVHEPHLQLGDHVVPQLRQSTRIRQEPNIFTFFRSCLSTQRKSTVNEESGSGSSTLKSAVNAKSGSGSRTKTINLL